MASMDFSDRHVVITGGTGALGSAVVGALVDAGARCTVPYVHLTEAQRFCHREHERVKLVAVTDLADEHSVAKVYDGIEPWASIHIAGGFAMGNIGDTGRATLLAQIETNLVSCFLCCRAAVSAMQAAGGGRIVNVAARPGLEWRHGGGMTAYTVAKAGVAALTVALAEEVVRDSILVNAVAPSIMDTPANRKAMPQADHEAWPKVEQVAATILFLASPGNTVTRGAVVPVYGKS
jgi:NAD(P)-dependent dehydrogenase (short-subunit alcohol dehydrogenase family)